MKATPQNIGDELVLCRYLHARARKNRVPLAGNFELTPCCNLQCRMCYVRLSPAEVRERGGLLDAEQWLAFGKEAVEKGMLFLLLTGGEPMTHPQFKEIYRSLHRMGLMMSINTNGTLIDREMVDFLRENVPYRVNISLYGAGREAYESLCGDGAAFDRALFAIRALREAGISVKVNFSATPQNADDLYAVADIAKECGARFQPTFYMFPALRRGQVGENAGRLSPAEAAGRQLDWKLHQMDTKQFLQYAEAAEKGLQQFDPESECMELPSERLSCRAGSSSFWVTWDGHMVPCGMMTKPTEDLREMGFSTAWEKTIENTKAIMMPAKCSVCTMRNICTVCPSVCLAESGDFEKAPAYLCEQTRILSEKMAKTAQNFREETQ